MSHTFSQLVWLGANTASEPAGIVNNAAQVTLFEAREAACKALQQKFPQKNVTVTQIVLTTTNTTTEFTEYNLAEFSAIQPATGLKKLFPGLKAINSEQLKGTAVSEAIHGLKLNDNNNLLIVDIADNNLALLKAIESAKQLHFFSAIYVQTANEPLYANAATSTEVTTFLEAQGYLLEQTTSNDPDLPWLSFDLNPLWTSLQEAQHSNNILNAELTKLRQTLEQQVADQKQKHEAATAQATASKQELQKQEARVKEINAALAAANKAKQDTEQQLAAIKHQLTTTQQQLAKVQQEISQNKTQIPPQTENYLSQTLEKNIQKLLADQTKHLTDTLNAVKNNLSWSIGNSAKQVESFIGVQNYLDKGIKPLSFHGWPISSDIGLYIAGLIDTNNYDVIIEFGSGTSTVLMAKALISKHRGVQTKALANTSQSNEVAVQDQTFTDLPARIVTFEHNSLYHGKTTQALKNNGVDHLVDLVHAPLVDYQYKDGSQYLYYNCNEKLQELAKIFKGRKANILVLVDGPPGATNKNARFPALPHLLNNLPEHSFTIIMDDYNRAEEKEIIEVWRKICESRFIAHTTEEVPSEKGLAVLRIE